MNSTFYTSFILIEKTLNDCNQPPRLVMPTIKLFTRKQLNYVYYSKKKKETKIYDESFNQLFYHDNDYLLFSSFMYCKRNRFVSKFFFDVFFMLRVSDY